MADPTYFVTLFRRRNGALIAAPRIAAGDYLAAIGEALRAQEAAGAIVFARDEEAGDGSGVEIILKVGDVPDELPFH